MSQLHEHKAKQILAAHGIAIPRGRLAESAGSVREIAAELNLPVVVKAQIHSTSRAALGGVKFANSPEEAEAFAAEMLSRKFAGNLCESVLIDEKAAIEREYYLGFIVDTTLKRPTLLFSNAGGSGVEERSDSMKKLVCSIRREPTIDELKTICDDESIAEILQKLYRVARSTDARTAEINPLARLKNGKLVALDCRISIDDYADFRQKDLGIEIARELGHTPTKLERIAWHIEKGDFRGTFFFVEILPGAECGTRSAKSDIPHSEFRTPHLIGFHGAGGGGSMASLDAAQRNGLLPACYVDTSGNPPASKVYRAAKIILSIPDIKGYFLSGSGVASQEQFVLARAVVKAFLEVKPEIPAVLRLGGNGEDVAKELVERYASQFSAAIEAYRKKDSADFCAARLHELISNAKTQSSKDAKTESSAEAGGFSLDYEFATKTGTVSFDYSQLNSASSEHIVASCPQKILKLNEDNLPVLAIDAEEAERGKCSECLACEFASLDLGLSAVKIDFPIEELD